MLPKFNRSDVVGAVFILLGVATGLWLHDTHGPDGRIEHWELLLALGLCIFGAYIIVPARARAATEGLGELSKIVRPGGRRVYDPDVVEPITEPVILQPKEPSDG
jgi:hypothetical protein